MFSSEVWAQLLPHQQINNIILIISTLLCLLVLGMGYIRYRLQPSTLSPHAPGIAAEKFPHGVDFAVTGFILFGICSSILDLNPPLAAGAEEENSTEAMGLGFYAFNFILQLLPYALPFILYSMRPRAAKTFISKSERVGWLLLTIPAIYAFSIVFVFSGMQEWIIHLTQTPEEQDIVVLIKESNIELQLYLAASAIIIAPLGEEVLFRGFLYPCLKVRVGRIAAILLSSLSFGAVHMSLAQLPILTFFGILLCYAYERSHSIWLPIAIHFIFNTLNILLIIYGPA